MVEVQVWRPGSLPRHSWIEAGMGSVNSSHPPQTEQLVRVMRGNLLNPPMMLHLWETWLREVICYTRGVYWHGLYL